MRVLVYGAGQLAQMMYLAGAPLGIEVEAVDVNTETLVHPVSKLPLEATLAQAIEAADALTVEFEHVPEHLLEQAEKSGKLMPSMEAILVGADRVREKALLDNLQVANCPHRIVTQLDELDRCLQELGDKLIIKASRDGYDGYGQWRLTEAAQLEDIKASLSGLNLQQVPLIVEQMLSFDRELSLIGVRSKSGEIKVYLLTENLHYQGQLHVSVAPAPGVTQAIWQQAQEIFTRLAQGMQYTGVLAVEMFQCGDTLLVNELAPRVHNSGHWTNSGSDTSQFENHLRAIVGLPLGDTQARTPAAMVNIIGCGAFSRDLLSIPGCHLHWYGKTVREKRKMGHINLTADNYQQLGNKMAQLAGYVPSEAFPMLPDEAEKLSKLTEKP